MFSIVTPSLNMLTYLKRCNASFSDQGVPYEHIVMDGGSTDGTAEWLSHNPAIISHVGKDRGIYDAVNKGFQRARGDIISHLNCDEQYLTGTLAFVRDYFDRHPEVDVLFGDVLLIRPDGTLLSYRKGAWPSRPLLLSTPMYMATASTFLRRRIIQAGEFYDESYRSIGDLEYYLRLLHKRYVVRHVSRYLSAFTMTGNNYMLRIEVVAPERARLLRQFPWWMTRFGKAWRIAGWGAKFIAGAYFQPGPISYSLFVSENASRRQDFLEPHPSFRWRTV